MRVACLWFAEPVAVERVAEHCLRFSPQICIRAKHAVFIEVGKCARLYSEQGFLARIKVVLRKLELESSVAIASDIGKALVTAKFSISEIGDLPLEALFDLADPFATDVVLRKYIEKLIAAFGDLGVKTLSQFQKIPVSELASRFGRAGILCQKRIAGESIIEWPKWTPPEVISEYIRFPVCEFYGELEPLLFELKRHLDAIYQRLWGRALKAQELTVRIFLETNSYQKEKVREYHFEFFAPQSATKGTLLIIKERLSREFEKKPITTPIEALETIVKKTVTGSSRQKNLLHDREEAQEELHALVSQLREVFGDESSFQAELLEDRRPERSWKKSEGFNKKLPVPEMLDHSIPVRPTHLLKRPERVEVTAGFIHIRLKRYRITRFLNTVERITGGWSERPSEKIENSYDRNYFTIEVEGGRTLFIFQNPKLEFFLHGYFG